MYLPKKSCHFIPHPQQTHVDTHTHAYAHTPAPLLSWTRVRETVIRKRTQREQKQAIFSEPIRPREISFWPHTGMIPVFPIEVLSLRDPGHCFINYILHRK